MSVIGGSMATKAATATEKQVSYAMALLGRSEHGNEWMNSGFKRLGATMRERQGRVEDWVRGLSRARCSELIGRLKAE